MVTKLDEPLPIKPTFRPPEHAEQLATLAAPAMVLPLASASKETVTGLSMLTLSKVEVFSTVLLWAVTAMPCSALLAIVTLIAPTCVQLTPSAEAKPVNVFPERTSRTQYGATGPAICASCTAPAPVEGLYCMFTPWPGVTNTNT